MMSKFRPGEFAKNKCLCAQKRFEGFKSETEKASHKPVVKDNPVQAALKKAWNAWKFPKESGSFEAKSYYNLLVNNTSILQALAITAKDVAAFSIYLSGLKAEDNDLEFGSKAGIFLSAIIHLSPEKKFNLYLTAMDSHPRFLGYRNSKIILVKGDVGESLGEEMSSGMITVEGNCSHFLGAGMSGGKIHIKGNSGDTTGLSMEGGEIHVDGWISGFEDNIIGGRIYQGGALLVEGDDSDGEDY